ncbi:MAG: BlaI/MecI/CopY family transcriptional regulator [Clostridia bacterium]|nr:BlaI/MecI/CopY family transcriptional regulator [Clostridia bacterium]
MSPTPHDQTLLTPTEWRLMECLWEHAPRTGREAVDWLKAKVGWSRSTTLTLLRRMTEKGLILCTEEEGVRRYAPAIARREAALRETDDFLSRVYRGSVSLLMNALTEKQRLSSDEIDELYAILRRAEQEAKRDEADFVPGEDEKEG